MGYEIGDKVELESGKIVTITKVGKCMDGLVYGYGKPPIVIEENIIRKIED